MAEISPVEKDLPVESKENEDKNEEDSTTNACQIAIEDITEFAQQSVNRLQTSTMHQCINENQIEQHYAPGPLQPGGINFNEIHQSLERLILDTEDDMSLAASEKPRGSSLRQLDEVSKAAIVSHSLAAYITTLESRQLRKLATRLSSDTGLWICRLMRFFDSSSYLHEESREGLLRICRMVMHLKYPNRYAVEAYEALYARPPVIYISAAAKPNLGQYLCTQLGIPLSCLSLVPCNTMFGSSSKMDIAALERTIQEDIAAARTPLLIVANAGSPITGQVDTLNRLQEICKTNDIWLHVEGFSLAALALVSVPNLPARIGDSMTIPLGVWLGIPALPFVTLFKAVESTSVHAAGLSSFNLHVRLNCIPLWTVLQTLGHDGVVNRIRHCFELSERLLVKLEQTPRIAIVGNERLKSKEGQTYSVDDVMNKPFSTNLLFDILVPVVLFQYVADDSNANNNKAIPLTNEVDDSSSKLTKRNPPYFDNLNSWLGQILMRDMPTVKLDIIELDQHGFAIRFSPLESAHAISTTLEDIDDMHNWLHQQLAILNATVKTKEVFHKLVESHANLQVVEITSWAGLGAVRYIPSVLVGRLNELTDSDKDEINRLNSELVAKLKSTDSAFSLGEGDDGMLGVRFGMVTDDLDTKELIGMVLSNGLEVEESSKYLESMAEMVRIGIEETNKELEKESVEKLMQEGILRHVPIVGSFVNWWSPKTDATVKGRSFNLASGVIETTENIYKYHMQVQKGTKVATDENERQHLIVNPIENEEHKLELQQNGNLTDPPIAN